MNIDNLNVTQLLQVVRKASLELPISEDRSDALDLYLVLMGSASVYVPGQQQSIVIPRIIMDEIKGLWEKEERIQPVKLLCETTGLGLKDAREAIEYYMENVAV